jgi:hypothetical protein
MTTLELFVTLTSIGFTYALAFLGWTVGRLVTAMPAKNRQH